MSFLTDAERDTLRVKRMILHVVGKKDTDFVPEPEIEVQQEEFFRDRVLGAAASGVHSFTAHSQVRPLLEQMATGQLTFQDGGQKLSQLFWRDHVKTSSSGAFFVLELRSDDAGTVFYALIKYDYREAVELSQVDGQNVLRAIVQAFIKDRRAIQKFCLMRVQDGQAQNDVTASDRMEEAPDLTDYFEKYLGVNRTRSTKELSDRLNEALRGAFEELRPHLPKEDVGPALEIAKQALIDLETVTNDDIVNAVYQGCDRPADETLKSKIDKVVRRKLRARNLEEVEFRPNRSALQAKPKRLVRTAEEVKIEYPDDELGRSVTREVNGEETLFTIRTGKKLVEDKTVPYRVDRSPATADRAT